MNGRINAGFTLIEVLIAVAIIGIVSSVALSSYQSYITTANMAKVNEGYQSAIRTAVNFFSKAKARTAMGLPNGLPVGDPNDASDAWIEIFNGGNALAPGGGPAYVNKTVTQTDANEVGAIRVDYDPSMQRLTLWRPKYLELTRYRARVSADSLTTEQRN